LYAILPTIKYYPFVFYSYEKVYPVYYGEGYEVQLIVVFEFVFTARGFLLLIYDFKRQVQVLQLAQVYRVGFVYWVLVA
jgi:hypothetical protein